MRRWPLFVLLLAVSVANGEAHTPTTTLARALEAELDRFPARTS